MSHTFNKMRCKMVTTMGQDHAKKMVYLSENLPQCCWNFWLGIVCKGLERGGPRGDRKGPGAWKQTNKG